MQKASTGIIIAVIFVCPLILQAATLSRDSLILSGQAGQRTISFGSRYLIFDSERVLKNGQALFRDQHYVLDYAQNELLLAQPLELNDTIKIVFLKLDLALMPPLQYMPPAREKVEDSIRPPSGLGLDKPASSSVVSEEALKLGGSKSLAIRMGSEREATVEQALQVSIDGRLARDLEINAYLSDQEMPLSASGSTQELEQLDRVYLEAKSPAWGVIMGDYDLSLSGFQFLNMKRQVKGISGRGSFKNIQAQAATSLPQARRGQISFSGQDGVQGPYPLLPENSLNRILPQSEKIWLDGEMLKRGALDDYTIDYQTGQLTFTPRRPITSYSRIMAEYQYAKEDFRRSLNAFILQIPAKTGFLFGGGYYNEGDDPNHPLALSWSQDQKRVLEAAGDDSSLLWVDGGVESDSGDYIRQDSIYVYVGTGGQYRVSFTRVGPGRGDYRYDPLLGGYRYVGAGQGDYIALIKLPRPERQRLMAMISRYQNSGLKAEVEAAWSDWDRNLLSAKDDGDNMGSAIRYDLSWSQDSLVWGGFKISSRAWQEKQNFWNGAVAWQPDFYQEWGLRGWQDIKETDQHDGLRYHKHQAEYRPGRLLALGGGYGLLALAGNRSLTEREGWLSLKPRPNWENTYRYRRHLLQGPWFTKPWDGGRRVEHFLNSRWALKIYDFEVGGRAAEDLFLKDGQTNLGRRAWEGWSGLNLWWGKSQWGTRLQRQEELLEDSVSGIWQGQWYANTWSNQLRLSPSRSADIRLEHSSRIKRMRPGVAGDRSDAHLGLVRLDLSPWQELINLNAEYSLNLSQSRTKAEQYFKVPDGSGNYRYDPATGSFYPDTSGNYIRQIIDQGDPKRTVDVMLKTMFGFDPSTYGASGWWSKMRMEFSGQAMIKSFRRVDLRLLAFAPDRLWDSQGNFSSGLDVAADIWYRFQSWSQHLRCRWQRSDDNQYQGRHLVQRNREAAAEASGQLNANIRLNFKAGWNSNLVHTMETGRESSIETKRLGAEIWRQVDRDLELNLSASTLWEDIQRRYGIAGDFAAIFREYTPEIGALRRWGLNGSLRLSVGATKRTANKDQASMPAEYQLSRVLGWTAFWRAQYDYRLNRNLIASAAYDGRSEPWRPARHNGRIEIRAYF